MNITFKDLYKKMEERVNNTITQEEFYDYLDNNIDIEKYLPISKKYAVAEIVSKKYEASLILQSEIKNFDSFIYMQYDIYKTLSNYPGESPVTVVDLNNKPFRLNLRVNPSSFLINELHAFLADEFIKLK